MVFGSVDDAESLFMQCWDVWGSRDIELLKCTFVGITEPLMDFCAASGWMR